MADTAHGTRRVIFCNGCKFAHCRPSSEYVCKHQRSKNTEVKAYDYCSFAQEAKPKSREKTDEQTAKYDRTYTYTTFTSIEGKWQKL